MRHILHVTSDFPLPATHGGRVAAWEHARALQRVGHVVDLIATVRDQPSPADLDAAAKVYRNITISPRNRSPLAALGLLSFQIASRADLKRQSPACEYDDLILENIYPAAILQAPDVRYRRLVLRVQNDEANYFRNLARTSTSFLKKLFYRIEAIRIARTEDALLREADLSLFISSDELSGSLGRKAANPVFFPPGIALDEIRPPPLRARGNATVLFVGSLFMHNNQFAVDWYLEHVHPRLRDIPGYRFMIAGRADADLARAIERRWARPGVELVYSPEDLQPLYDAAAVFVNPARESAGVKIKSIEAIKNGIPVVATPEGMAGTGLSDGEDVLVGKDGAEMADAIARLIEDPEFGLALALHSQESLRRDYDFEANVRAHYDDRL